MLWSSSGSGLLAARGGLPRLLVLLAAALGSAPCGVRGQEEPDFLPVISNYGEFAAVAVSSSAPDEDRVAKYIVPASGDPSLLPALFQNAHLYRFHHEFLAAVFPDRFPDLDMATYLSLVGRRASRQYTTGTITRYTGPGGQAYGFTVFTVGDDPEELLNPDEIGAVYQRLRTAFPLATASQLQYAPLRAAEILAARGWSDPGFPVRKTGSSELPEVIGYTPAVNFGRLRRFSLAEFLAAGSNGELDWQTIAVVDDAPGDAEVALGGLVTAVPQGELGHLAVRLARRGVPNAFVKDALTAFQPHDGKIIRLEVRLDDYEVSEATLEEAEDWWAEHRPSLPPLPAIDPSFDGMEEIAAMELDAPGVTALQRYGAKAANLAILYRHLPAEYQTQGFAIPFRHYEEFLDTNRIPSLSDPAMQVTYREFIEEFLADARFRTDVVFRRLVLERFRETAEEAGVVPEALLTRIRDRILGVFQDPEVKVRFRSSSNAEDSLEFAGAGIYSSTSVCLPDELDGDEEGPSVCDATKSRERTILRGLRRVWMSLWNDQAYEEREIFQIDHREASMGVLVTLAYPAEDANGVLFTGNPANPQDDGFLVNVQLGDESVVQPGVGIEPERDALVMLDGRVGRVIRLRPSSLVVPGQDVLEDGQLELLGNVVAGLHRSFLDHFDLSGVDPDDVLIDFEFKFQDGRLVVKQARPFLRAARTAPGPVYLVDVPPNTRLCGLWQEYRSPDDEFRLKSQIRLGEGRIRLPVSAVHVAARFIDRFEFGPDRRQLRPLNAGLFTASVRTGCCPAGTVWTTWSFDQDFDLDGEVLTLTTQFQFRRAPGEPLDDTVVLDGPFLSEAFHVFGAPAEVQTNDDVLRFASCTYETLPLWQIHVETAGGHSATFLERYRVPFAGSGPANVLRAEATLGGEHHEEYSYWRLVYAADHHNWNEEFRMLFDPPIAVGPTEGVFAFHVQEGFDGIPRKAALLDSSFREIVALDVTSYSKKEIASTMSPAFRRGDPNDDGWLDVSDAVTLLFHEFAGPSARLDCQKAGDINDDGALDISDPISLLRHLFLGEDPPAAPAAVCATDPTADSLGCERYLACE